MAQSNLGHINLGNFNLNGNPAGTTTIAATFSMDYTFSATGLDLPIYTTLSMDYLFTVIEPVRATFSMDYLFSIPFSGMPDATVVLPSITGYVQPHVPAAYVSYRRLEGTYVEDAEIESSGARFRDTVD